MLSLIAWASCIRKCLERVCPQRPYIHAKRWCVCVCACVRACVCACVRVVHVCVCVTMCVVYSVCGDTRRVLQQVPPVSVVLL